MSKADEIMMSMLGKGEDPTPPAEPTEEPVEPVSPDGGGDPAAAEEPVEDPQGGTDDPVEEPVDPTGTEEDIVPEEGGDGAEDPQSEEEEPENIYETWDEEGSEDPSASTSGTNFSEIGKAIGLEDEANGEGALVNAVKAKFTSYEEKIQALTDNQMPENIPDVLKDAVKIAAQGGDYSAYVSSSSVDYTAIPDVDLVAQSVADHFSDEHGVVNREALQEYMDNLTDVQIKIEAGNIRNGLEQHRQATIAAIEKSATDKRDKMMSDIQEGLKSFDERHGFKVLPSHKNEIMKAFKEDRVIQEMFYTNGAFDASKAIEVYFDRKYSGKIISKLKSSVRTETKKDVLDTVTNAQVNPPSSPPSPSEPERKVGMDAWLDDLKK